MSSPLKLANNATGTLASGIAAGDTSITLAAGQGARFPTLTGVQFFPATLIRSSDGAIEIVKVTARSSDTLTVTRAQESTTALAFVAGDRLELRLTAGTLTDEVARVEAALNTATQTNGATSKSTPVDADEIPLADSAASFGLKKLTWANLKAGLFSALGALIAAATGKSTPVDADGFVIADSAASNASKLLTWANLKATMFSSWGALINGATSKSTPVDADAIALMDSAASNATKKLTWASLKATLKTYFDTLYGYPSQTGNSGKALVTDGTGVSWGYPAQLANTSGAAPSYAVRAWVNFNGTGTPAIRASANVSSITDNGTGDYTVNYTIAQLDANYSLVGTAQSGSAQVNVSIDSPSAGGAPSTYTASAARIQCYTDGGVAVDPNIVNVAVFR